MDGDVIDTGARRAATMIEQVGRAGHAARYFADQAAFAAPVSPHGAAVAVIPFRPLRGKRADLIAAEPQIPGLGNKFDRGENRVLPDRREEPAVAVNPFGPRPRVVARSNRKPSTWHTSTQYRSESITI